MLRLLSFVALCFAAADSLAVRKMAPSWSGQAAFNDKIVPLSSADYKGKWLVMFFYPMDFTFVCPTEIKAFDKKVADFKKIGVEVVGVSIDSKFTHLQYTRTERAEGGVGKLSFPLLADVTKKISKDFDVLVEEADDDLQGITLRGTFIIGPEGKIRSMTVNDEPIGRNIDETYRLVEAAQYADANKGQGCPANWKKGGKTIFADPDGAKSYFKEELAK